MNKPLETISTEIITFIRTTFELQAIDHAVIAVSGGIDSAVSLTLLTQSLQTRTVTPILLPYGDQDMTDATVICQWNGFHPSDCVTKDIKPLVDQLCELQNIPPEDHLRRGNIMARMRMILIFDLARDKSALVCGTENKSEHYLGYFTRFGDAASDLEPLSHLYKTQVRSLAAHLHLPENIISKPPSAGLWDHQTDESEMGFSYEDADRVLTELIDNHIPPSEISITGIPSTIIQAVCQRVADQSFKRIVPYTIS
jgi:NAD+ synthase